MSTMRLLVVCLMIAVTIWEARSAVNRTGPCPGIPLDSCECFQHLYDTYVVIDNMTDIIARNWGITLWYQDISHSFQKLLRTAPDSTSGFPAIGTWPSMSVWASNTVGFSIRQQPLPELWSYIIRDLPQWMQNILDKMSFEFISLLFKEILEHAAVALGGGNLFVFNEIGYSYARYGIEFCDVRTKPDDAKMTDFVQKYVCEDGQCDLAKGLWALFRTHYGAVEPLTFSERDQMMLVQGYTTKWCRLWPGKNITQCDDLVNTIVTKLLAHILLGSHRLFVDHDIPSGVHNGSNFSTYLTNLTIPQTHDLMLKMLNSTTLSLNHTAAYDWDILAQRMRFVAPLFWVFQDHHEMNCYPFSAEQEFLIRTNQSAKMDPHSWTQICDKDCCAANGEWDGEN